ncbi:hypothetical protein EV199_5105 [Pseudobacter ginsenosidimutans]|uniref:Uncharacterized protein n=1 Tax=Pseudobacter ginsenosidimutans TaxID=661488 RepID=A0A4Q7MR82_9BACT|nr:hypothetical protein EV199_5105 [Pseudobacter ginsenosidimutans]
MGEQGTTKYADGIKAIVKNPFLRVKNPMLKLRFFVMGANL